MWSEREAFGFRLQSPPDLTRFTTMPNIILYHVPPSFYSQIARLALRELGVDFQETVVAPGPPTFESYAPWYMSLNPNGTVPTLLHGEHPVPGSDKIVRYADTTLSEDTLAPDSSAEREKMEEWVAKLEGISIRELSYGAEKTKALGQRVNRMRLKNLAKRKARNPAMAAAYDRKIKDISDFSKRALQPETLKTHLQNLTRVLDEMDAWLNSHPWLAGDTYSLADTVWTVGVARLRMLGQEPLRERPHLGEWYERVKSRPSFAAADVWERFKPEVMARVLLKKFGPKLALIVAALLFGGYLLLAHFGGE